MNEEQIAAKIKEKAGFSDDLAMKAAEILTSQIFSGNVNKDSIIKVLTEKLKIDEAKANKAYDSVAGVLTGSLADAFKGIKGVFKK